MSRMYRSGGGVAKPENALKRSEELEAVGQKPAALQALHDVITSKRHRTWQKTLEDIMFKYIDLCVDLKRGRFLKDALIQYRNVCLQVNVNSLEEVIKYLLKRSNEKAEEAQAQAQVCLKCCSQDSSWCQKYSGTSHLNMGRLVTEPGAPHSRPGGGCGA